MKAQEALELSKKNDLDQLELDSIFQEVKKACEKGKNFIIWDNIRNKNIRKIELLGYEIKIVDYINNVLTIAIEWKNAKPNEVIFF